MIKQSYNTSRRALIISFFRRHADESYTADELASKLAAAGVSRSTVYRQLEALTTDGEIRKFSGESGAFSYQYAGMKIDCDDHLHLKCDECGRIIHLHCSEIDTHIKKDHNFLLDCRKTILYGVCGDCRLKTKA